jgi:hypothetical protein
MTGELFEYNPRVLFYLAGRKKLVVSERVGGRRSIFPFSYFIFLFLALSPPLSFTPTLRNNRNTRDRTGPPTNQPTVFCHLF